MAGSKNVLAVLLVITMFISLLGTMAALTVVLSQSGYKEVPVVPDSPEEDSGRVSAYLAPPPAGMTGRVAAYVSSEEGG